MSDMPEEIWAIHVWIDDATWYECFVPGTEKYIRADIHEARVKELEEQVKDERHVLKAWFNTRELAHEAIDAAVLDAAKGYLRTSRSGGMCPQESDIVAGVIKDMARLSVFADLFARAKMPLPSAPKERKENET